MRAQGIGWQHDVLNNASDSVPRQLPVVGPRRGLAPRHRRGGSHLEKYAILGSEVSIKHKISL